MTAAYPFRQKSVRGEPRPETSIERRCAERSCGASFIGLAPGKTGEAGIWDDRQGLRWFCSIEDARLNGVTVVEQPGPSPRTDWRGGDDRS